jgi:hypothetical protein
MFENHKIYYTSIQGISMLRYNADEVVDFEHYEPCQTEIKLHKYHRTIYL